MAFHCTNFTLGPDIILNTNQRTSGPVNAHLTPGPGIYFNVFIHVYNPRAGEDNPLETNVDVNRKPLWLCPFAANFKTISTHFFMFFHMYIAPGRGRQTPGVKILMSTERPYHFDHLLQVLKKSLWTLILYTFFNVFSHVYSPGAGADNALGSKFWSQQKGFITLTICCKFKKQSLSTMILYIFLIILYMNIAPGQEQTNPCGQIFMSTERPYHFDHLLQI